MSFTTAAIKHRLPKDHVLAKLHVLIDWSALAEVLARHGFSNRRGIAGVKPYDPLMMFKAVLLQAWHHLSDAALEEALKVRLDFIAFTGLDLTDTVPDETTLCRFRHQLVKKGLDQQLFQEVNRQLERHRLKVKPSRGAVLDATVIQSAARPKRCYEIAEDRAETEAPASATDLPAESPKVTCSESADPDAKWLKKGKRCSYGYKCFAAIDDQGEGFINHLDMQPANHSEVNHLQTLIDPLKLTRGARVYGDKGYASKANRALLKAKHLKSGIMDKAQRNTPLTARQKQRNRCISKIRYKVEQTFGTLHRRFHFARASYMGLNQVQAQALRKAMCFNLLKAANKITLHFSPVHLEPPPQLRLTG